MIVGDDAGFQRRTSRLKGSSVDAPDSQICICCNTAESEPHLRGLRRCARCGHVWADMRLSDEDLRQLYSAAYFEGDEYLDYTLEKTAPRRNFRARLRDLGRSHAPGKSIWEIGAAYGYFLEEARSAGFQVAGCDISEHAAAQARQRASLDVRAVDYLTLPAPAEPFDIVCLWDTVEHLAAPQLYLEKAAAELRTGGTIALSTGDIGSLLARRRGEKWRLIHPPTHLHYFSSASMRRLLDRLGFENIRITHPPFWRSADAVAYRLFGHPPGKPSAFVYRIAHAIGITRFAFPVNTFDLMCVTATRR